MELVVYTGQGLRAAGRIKKWRRLHSPCHHHTADSLDHFQLTRLKCRPPTATDGAPKSTHSSRIWFPNTPSPAVGIGFGSMKEPLVAPPKPGASCQWARLWLVEMKCAYFSPPLQRP